MVRIVCGLNVRDSIQILRISLGCCLTIFLCVYTSICLCLTGWLSVFGMLCNGICESNDFIAYSQFVLLKREKEEEEETTTTIDYVCSSN